MYICQLHKTLFENTQALSCQLRLFETSWDRGKFGHIKLSFVMAVMAAYLSLSGSLDLNVLMVTTPIAPVRVPNPVRPGHGSLTCHLA